MGLYIKAYEITAKIGWLIAKKHHSLLLKVNNSSIKHLWAAVKNRSGQSRSFNQYSNIGDENFTNEYFNEIATDTCDDRY